MRTTLTIDDDVLAAAKGAGGPAAQDARRSDLGPVAAGVAADGAARKVRNGVPLLTVRAGAEPVTPELVNRLHEELP